MELSRLVIPFRKLRWLRQDSAEVGRKTFQELQGDRRAAAFDFFLNRDGVGVGQNRPTGYTRQTSGSTLDKVEPMLGFANQQIETMAVDDAKPRITHPSVVP